VTPGNPAANFGRHQRLLEAKDFKKVFDENRFRASNQHFLILAIHHLPSHTGLSRLGIVVSKKNARRAVDRNRIKRIIREYFRRHVAPLTQSMDFVVLARPGLASLDNQNINSGLKSLFDNVLRKAAYDKQKQLQPHEH
jgi:ribonuclease P protein component